MLISISKVISRHNSLNYNKLTENTQISFNPIDSLYENYSYNVAFSFIKNWRNLSYSLEESAVIASDILSLIMDREPNYRNIYESSRLFRETIIPKVRNAKALKTNFKRKLARVNTNIVTKLNKKHQEIRGKDKSHDLSKSTLGKKFDEKKKDIAVKESLEALINSTIVMEYCDRLLENQDKLNKRFRLNSLFSNNMTVEEGCHLLCSLIDTYKLPVYQKYNIALETMLYNTHKKGVKTTKDNIAYPITEYYMCTINNDYEREVENLRQSLIENRFFDMSNLEETRTLFHINDIPLEKEMNKDVALEALSMKKIGQKIYNQNSFKILKMKFTNASKKTPEGLKSIIRKALTSSRSNIIDETSNVFKFVIITGVSLLGFSAGILAGIIAFTTMMLLSMHLEKKEVAKLIDITNKDIKDLEKKIEKTDDPDKKEKYKALLEQFKKDKNKFTEYEKKLYSDEENMDRDLDSDVDVGDIDLGDDFDFDFDDDFKESAILTEQDMNVILEMQFKNKLGMIKNKVENDLKKASATEKIACKTVDGCIESLKGKFEDAIKLENREAVIKGKILPPFSRCVKLAIGSGIVFLVSPICALIGLLGAFACHSKIRRKERQLVLDELDIELDMCERYLKTAEEKDDKKAIRRLLYYKKKLTREKQRLQFKMKVDWNQKVPDDKREY